MEKAPENDDGSFNFDNIIKPLIKSKYFDIPF